MGARITPTSGPALERAGDLAAILTNLDDGDVLFIDEVHRLPRVVEESLYPAMEDFRFDVVIGKGPSARTIRLDLPRFTLVGATTRTGLISGPVARPLRVRRPPRLLRRTTSSRRSCGAPRRSSASSSTADGADEIASRSRGTPRIANRLLKRVRDYAEVRADGRVTAETARDALALFEVDELGLDKVDRAILDALCRTFVGPGGRARHARGRGRARRPRRSRTCTSRSSCSAGCSSARPAAGSRRPPAFAHIGLHVARAPAKLPSLFQSRDGRPTGADGRRAVRSARPHRARHHRERQGQRASRPRSRGLGDALHAGGGRRARPRSARC